MFCSFINPCKFFSNTLDFFFLNLRAHKWISPNLEKRYKISKKFSMQKKDPAFSSTN